MSYFIEFGLDRGAGLYAEFVIINKNTGDVLPGDGVDHQFYVERDGCDYGHHYSGGQLLASNLNGLITAPAPGVVAMNIPPGALCAFHNSFGAGWYDFGGRHASVVRCKMLAVPADPSFTKTLFTGTISFGDRVMNCARIKLGVYPLYPNSASGSLLITAQVAQVKQQLVLIGAYDQVEAGLGAPTSAATISWNTGGPISVGGPLANSIAATLNLNTVAMSLLIAAAASITL